jgi:hypothetical protein
MQTWMVCFLITASVVSLLKGALELKSELIQKEIPFTWRDRDVIYACF